MQFLTPLFWIAGLALTVPILLHLVQRQTRNRILFASLMFIPRRTVRQLRRRKVERWFLLLLRCLGLLLLIGAFSRPVLKGGWFDRFSSLSPRSTVILLDNSMSMSREEVWPRALRAARDRIASMGEPDEALLVLFSDSGEVLSQWTKNSRELLQILNTSVVPSFSATSYLEALKLAVQQFKGDRYASREIYLITDLQRSGLGPTQGWKAPEEIQVDIEDVGHTDANLFVEEARLSRNVFSKRYPYPVLILLATDPPAPSQGEVQLFIEGQIVAREHFNLGEEGKGQVTLQPFELNEGITRGKLVVVPFDSLIEDNTYHFVLQRKEPFLVQVLSSRSSRSLHLQTALSTGENHPFRVELVQPPLTSLDASRVRVLILNDLRNPPATGVVLPFLEAGGGLIVAAGSQTQENSYAHRWESILPAKLTSKHFVRSRTKSFTAITQASWEHPIFSTFKDIQRSAVSASQFFGYWEVEPSNQAAVVARFDDGAPALLEQEIGTGRVLLFTSSLDASWSDFPVRSSYLPFWEEAVQYASGFQSSPSAFRIGQAVDVAQATEPGTSGTWNVIDPTGKRVVGLDGARPESLRLKFPGHYEIRDNKRTDWIAVNTMPAESLLNRVPVEDFRALFIPGESTFEGATADTRATVRERQQAIWWILLLAAALVFLFEAWVANWRMVEPERGISVEPR